MKELSSCTTKAGGNALLVSRQCSFRRCLENGELCPPPPLHLSFSFRPSSLSKGMLLLLRWKPQQSLPSFGWMSEGSQGDSVTMVSSWLRRHGLCYFTLGNPPARGNWSNLFMWLRWPVSTEGIQVVFSGAKGNQRQVEGARRCVCTCSVMCQIKHLVKTWDTVLAGKAVYSGVVLNKAVHGSIVGFPLTWIWTIFLKYWFIILAMKSVFVHYHVYKITMIKKQEGAKC